MDEDDDYVGQLREVFDRCDTDNTGTLNRDGLLELCKQLELEDQAEQLIGELLGDSTDGLVDFDTFKEAFVHILATAVDFDDADLDLPGASDVDLDGEDDRSVSSYHNPVSDADIKDEVSPKYVKGNKKYGRKSKPDINADLSGAETDISSYAGLPPDQATPRSEQRGIKREGDNNSHHAPLMKRNSVSFADDLSQGSLDLEKELDFDHEEVVDGEIPPDEDAGELSSPERVDGEGTSILETFEAEGLNNASISQYAGTPTTDQSQVAAIQAIWEEVGVGKDGFLDIDELKIVCEHIGMDDMDNEELDNLFIKLDEDKDGQVSFDEFLQGLFSHTASATPTPIPIGMSPAQRANLRRLAGSSMDDPYQRTATPSLLVANTKLFSMLDPDNTGYARPEDIVEQLEQEGIDNPTEAMEIMDVNLEAGKINLQDLSSRFENILLAKGDDDGVYQVALATYTGELKYLKSQLDIVTDEREHLKDDITEANQRNTKLAQEVDDRHNNILRQNEKQLQALEEQHQDKINSLQAEVERERDNLTTEEAGVREKLEKDIKQLKADDALNKEKILLLQKENSRLEEELVEATERLIDNEKTIQKQQRDLEGFQELEERLADLESNRESNAKQQEEYFESNIKEYQEKIRAMQDQMDELTQENDLLKNQSTERKTRRRTSKIHSSKPGRYGSVLSDYVNKPIVERRLSSSENESELEELDPAMSLPARSGGDGTSNEEEERKKLEEEREKWETELEQLKEDHKKELEEARIMFEHELKDVEEKYKIEIAGLEEEMDSKKDDARDEYERLRSEFKAEQAKLVDELERRFKAERTEIQEKNEREKQSREEEVTREKADLRDELEAKYNEELDNRITELKQQLLAEKTELENLLTKEKSDVEKDLLKAKNEAEMKLKQRELDFIKEKGELESEFGKEKSDLLQNYNAKVHELEEIFINGEVGLKGQLRQDFTDLLDKHKSEMDESYSKEIQELQDSHEREKDEMNHAFELERVELMKGKDNERSDLVERLQKEKSELINKNKKDKLELFEKHRREKSEMTEKFKKDKDDLNEKHKREKAEWDQKLQKERERFRKEREDREEKFQRELAALELNLSVDKDNLEHTIRMDVEDKIRQDLKSEMEADYVDQVQRLNDAFEDEKAEFITEKEEMEDRLRATSASPVESAIKPVAAQEVHAPMPPGGATGPQGKSVSIQIQTDKTDPDIDELLEENKELEKRLQHAQTLIDGLTHNKMIDNPTGENIHNKQLVDEDSQTEGVELVDHATDTTADKEVDDEEMEVEAGTIDNIQKFFTGLFGDGPRAKGIQTEIKPVTERISQTDINGKYFQQKFILEQKLKDTEALSGEMVKTILAMTYTEKAWEKAKKSQRIEEGMQTDRIEMLDKVCFAKIDNGVKVETKHQWTNTDEDSEILDDAPVGDEKMKPKGTAMITDGEGKEVVEQQESEDTEMPPPKNVAPKDNLADIFAQTHLAALKAAKRPKRQNPFLKDQTPDDQSQQSGATEAGRIEASDIMEDVGRNEEDPVNAMTQDLDLEERDPEETLQAPTWSLPRNSAHVTGHMTGHMVSTEVQTGEDLLDAEVALAKRMEREWAEEKRRLQNELRDAQAFMFKTSAVPKKETSSNPQSPTEPTSGTPQADGLSEIEMAQTPKTDKEQSPVEASHAIATEAAPIVNDIPGEENGGNDEGQNIPPGTAGATEGNPAASQGAETQHVTMVTNAPAGDQRGVDANTQTTTIETLDHETSTTQDRLAGSQGNSLDGVVDADVEVEAGAIDNIQKFFTGFFGGGPRAKGIQTEMKPISERNCQTEIGEKYFKEKVVLEQKLKDTEQLVTDKAWEAAKRLQNIDEESQTDINMNDGVFHKDHDVGPVSVEEVESLKAQVAELEAEKEVLGEKLRASKALSEVMAASMQSLAKSDGDRQDRDKIASPNGKILEDDYQMGSAENDFYLKLLETDEGELETVQIPTGRVGGHSRQALPQHKRRVVSDDMKQLLQDLDNGEGVDEEWEEVRTNPEGEQIQEDTILQQAAKPVEFQMPYVASALQKEQGVQVDLIGLDDGTKTPDLGPEGDMLQKSVVDLAYESFELIEDDDGCLQRNKVKSDKSVLGDVDEAETSRQENRIVSSDMKQILRDIEEDGESDVVDDVNGEMQSVDAVQEEACLQQVAKPVKFQMPHVSPALQKEQGIQVDLIQDDDKRSPELGPEGNLLEKSMVELAHDGFELIEDGDGCLQRKKVKSDRPKDDVDKDEMMKELEQFGIGDVDDDVNDWGFSDDGDAGTIGEVQEEPVASKQVQPTKYQMPHVGSAIQKDQQVQADILCSLHEEEIDKYKTTIEDLQESIEKKKVEVLGEFERVRREFKAEQARIVEQMKEEFDVERVEAEQEFKDERKHFEQVKYQLQEQLESSPGGGTIKKDQVDAVAENVHFVEDKDGRLQASKVKSNPTKLVVEVTLKEMMQSLESINDADKDDDDWDNISDEDGHERVQEESCVQQQVQMVEFSMPNVATALQQEQAVQVEILAYKPPHLFATKLAQTESAKLASKEIQTVQSGAKDTAMQTLSKDIDSRITQTEHVQLKERGVQMETVGTQNQSSQWEMSQEKVGVQKEIQTVQSRAKDTAMQTLSKDVDSRITQTEHVQLKERGVQMETVGTKNQSSQWEMSQEKVGVQTISPDISRITQTERVQLKERGVQMETVGTKNQSSQWEMSQEKVGVQTISPDLSTVKTQTEHSETKERSIQVDKQRTEDRACQCVQEGDRRLVAKPSQTEGLEVKQQSVQTMKIPKVPTENRSVQMTTDSANVSTETDVIENKDKGYQVEVVPDLENKGSQWESSYIKTKFIQTEDLDQTSVPSQTDELPVDLYPDKSFIQYHVSIAEQNVPAFVENVTQSSQTQILVSDTGTSMEVVGMLSRSSQVGNLVMADSASQWEQEGNTSSSMSMQTESKTKMLSGVQTDSRMVKQQSQQASVEQTHKTIQHQVDVQHDASQTSVYADVKSTQTLLLLEHQQSQTDGPARSQRGSQSEAARRRDSSSQVEGQMAKEQSVQASVEQLHRGSQIDFATGQTPEVDSQITQTEFATWDRFVQTDRGVTKEGKMQTDLIKSVDANTQMIQVKKIEKQNQANLLTEKDRASPVMPTPAKEVEQHTKTTLPEEKAVRAEAEREEAIQMSSTQQLHAAQHDTSADKQHQGKDTTTEPADEPTLTYVSSLDESSETEGPDEILSPHPSRRISDSTLTPESSEGDVMGLLRGTPFGSFLPEKKTRPKRDRRRRRDRVRQLPDIPDQSRKTRSQISDETSGEETGKRRYKKSSYRRQLPTPPGSDSATAVQEHPKRHPKISDIKEMDKKTTVPQRTHGELSSQDSLFSRLFSRRDSKINLNDKPVSEEPSLKSRSVTGEASAPQSAHLSRPSSLGLAEKKAPTDPADTTRVTSPLTEQVTSQKDKLTQMLNLFRPDAKTQEQSKTGPQRSSSLPAMPEEEFLHKKATTPLEAPRRPGDQQNDFELHPSSSPRLPRQRPPDGQDANKVQTPSSLQGQARIEMLEQHCDKLKRESSEASKKLLEAEMQVSIQDAQHMRELQRLKDKHDRVTDKEVSKLKKELLEKDHVLRELENTLSTKADQLGIAANRSKDELNQEVKGMRDQKADLEKKYRNTQRLLDEYMRKLKEQLTRSTRSDVLVKELYVENSKLQKALQVTEERQKIAERNCHNLREKNHAYLHVLRRIAPAAM